MSPLSFLPRRKGAFTDIVKMADIPSDRSALIPGFYCKSANGLHMILAAISIRHDLPIHRSFRNGCTCENLRTHDCSSRSFQYEVANGTPR